MENLITLLGFVTLSVLVLGMINPKWVIPERFELKYKRITIFLVCFTLIAILGNVSSDLKEKNMTPQERATRDLKEKTEKDSLNMINAENAKEKERIKSLNTEKGDFVDGGQNYKIEVLKVKDKKRTSTIMNGGYGKYRYFQLKITNITKFPIDIDRDNFYLESENGAIYKHNINQAISDFVISINRDAFAGEDLAPNVPVKGNVAFEIPEEDGNYKLKFIQ